MKKHLTLVLLVLASLLSAQVSIFPTSTAWKYLDDGTNQGTAWYASAFNDATWASGNAQLGYGESDEATVLSYGPSSGNKYITHYFRKTFSVPSGTFVSFTFKYKVDDGMIVYVNGAELFRANMPAGAVNYTTLASGSPDDGQTTLTTTVAANTFSTGTNVIAVEVHQNAANSSDETFEMSLTGDPLVTGPAMVPLNVSLFPLASTWKYLDDGSNQGTAWSDPAFSDLAWPTGTAQFGFGEADEATLLNACGVVVPTPTCTNKYITHYFRKTISIPSVSGYTAYTFNYKRDDGIIVYVNGVEAFRDNMPAGAVNYTTWAASNVSDDGQTLITTTVAAATFSAGTNLVAVELHNRDASSSDATFEMALLANTNSMVPVVPTIVKGPYLQVGTKNSMIVRWETNVASDTRLAFGTSTTALSSILTNTSPVTMHEVKITGLNAYTKYFYEIGTTTQTIQGDADNFFLTSPAPGAEGSYRFWVIGDCGNSSTNQVNVKNQFKNYNGNRLVDGWLTLGDNAYSSGSNPEFNAEFFDIYQGDVMKNKVLWPSPGNHDYSNGASTATTVPYFSIFNTPANGEAGGVPSGNPAYYSYDYGNIHFISLDSYGAVSGNKMYDTLGAQAVWLKQDLAANNKKWTIAYWHHPPYTMGSHNSDTEGDLVAIRQRFIRILERYKVDLILCGHSHDYERSKLMTGHYGNEASFNAATHNLSQSSALYDGTPNSCPYTKDSVLNKIGTVYVVSGSSGQLGGQQGAFPHNAMYYSNASNGGSMIIDIEGNRLDAKWLCADGQIRDKFTMYKDVNSVKSYTVLPGQTVTVQASWPGNYTWNTAATTKTVSISSLSTTSFWVKDPTTCVADTFKLKVLPAVNFTMTTPYCVAKPIAFTDLSTNNATAWSWSVSPSAGVTISSASAQSPTITFSNAGTYTVSLIADNMYGSGTVISKTVVVNTNPSVAALLNPSTICFNQSATLTAGGNATSYQWDSGSTAASLTVSPVSTTSYTLTGTDANGCQSTNSQTLTVNPLPTVGIISSPVNPVVCAGQTLSMSGTGASSYNWTGGISNASSFSLSSGASYTVTGTDANNCKNTAMVTVTVNALPQLSVTVLPAAAVCDGKTLALTASGAVTYTWSGAITNGTAFTPTQSTLYTATGTDANGCTSSISQSVTVNSLPVVTITGTTAVCLGSNVTLTAGGAASYLWNTGATTTAITVSPASATSYTVTGTDSKGCVDTEIKTITVNALPAVSISGNMLLCEGQTTTITASGASAYSWSEGTNGSVLTIAPKAGYNYMVTGSDANGCKNSATTSFTVNPLPALLTQSTHTLICAGESATLSVTGAATYVWNTSAGTSSIVVSPVTSTTYNVTGTSNSNCSASASIVQNVSECTGIQAIAGEMSTRIYPNPNKGNFTIELNMQGDFRMELLNTLGERVYSAKLSQGSNLIHLEKGPGVYFYLILNNNSVVETGKLIRE